MALRMVGTSSTWLAEDVIFEYIITTPGYPRRVEGRKAVAELYRPYGTMIVLDRCHDLAVHHDIETGVVVLEYASEGRVVATGAPYSNRYISVLTITDRKVSHWRDYLDPVAVFDALGWPSRLWTAQERGRNRGADRKMAAPRKRLR
jgi:ketosteroid isomerase-like protein